MSILGIGCDIVDIRRIQRILSENCVEFLEKIFTQYEVAILREKYSFLDIFFQDREAVLLDKLEFLTAQEKSLAAHIAKRFSAKESFSKALRSGIGKICGWQDVEVESSASGAPAFTMRTNRRFNVRSYLSLSDEIDYAVSYVLLLSSEAAFQELI